jgi:hypothetical protein
MDELINLNERLMSSLRVTIEGRERTVKRRTEYWKKSKEGQSYQRLTKYFKSHLEQVELFLVIVEQHEKNNN